MRITYQSKGVYSERGHASHVMALQREARARALAYAREQIKAEQSESEVLLWCAYALVLVGGAVGFFL